VSGEDIDNRIKREKEEEENLQCRERERILHNNIQKQNGPRLVGTFDCILFGRKIVLLFNVLISEFRL
jgi:hypothetical protein